MNLKNYARSIIIALVLVVINFFHFSLDKLIASLTGRDFAGYVIYALILAFFLLVFFRIFFSGKYFEIAVLLLCCGLVFYFLLSRPLLLFKLTMLEMFILGLVIAWDTGKGKSYLSFIILGITAILVDISSALAIGGSFYIFDAWRNALTALCGFLTTSLMRR